MPRVSFKMLCQLITHLLIFFVHSCYCYAELREEAIRKGCEKSTQNLCNWIPRYVNPNNTVCCLNFNCLGSVENVESKLITYVYIHYEKHRLCQSCWDSLSISEKRIKKCLCTQLSYGSSYFNLVDVPRRKNSKACNCTLVNVNFK